MHCDKLVATFQLLIIIHELMDYFIYFSIRGIQTHSDICFKQIKWKKAAQWLSIHCDVVNLMILLFFFIFWNSFFAPEKEGHQNIKSMKSGLESILYWKVCREAGRNTARRQNKCIELIAENKPYRNSSNIIINIVTTVNEQRSTEHALVLTAWSFMHFGFGDVVVYVVWLFTLQVIRTHQISLRHHT